MTLHWNWPLYNVVLLGFACGFVFTGFQSSLTIGVLLWIYYFLSYCKLTKNIYICISNNANYYINIIFVFIQPIALEYVRANTGGNFTGDGYIRYYSYTVCTVNTRDGILV